MDKRIRLILMHCIVWIVIIGLYLQLTNDTNTILMQHLVLITCFYIVIFKIANVLLNLLQYAYDVNSTVKTKNSFKFDANTSIFKINLIIFIIFIIIEHEHVCNFIQIFDALTCTICMLISWILLRIIDFDKERKEVTCDINLMQGLDYASCMAYSYYYGYLKHILPSTGSLNKGLIEKIENIEDIHNINISIHKLIILIPSSSYIPPDIKDVSYQWMESAMNLESEIRNRAGVKGRIYHNSVYKIYPNGPKLRSKPLYVVIEGASPLQTFYEVQRHAHCETSIYQKYCKDIIKRFYEKLKQLINDDPECKDLCELIYYNDYDSNGIKVNVAKIILERLFNISN
ncbi:Stimulator of interferon genes protein homolog [Anthophora retusa]